jgi:hypothetical protein
VVLVPETAVEQQRLEDLMAKWPTTDSAWGCMNCLAIFRELENARCPHCKSESCFDVAAALDKPSVSIERLRSIVDTLEAELALAMTTEDASHE